VRSLARAVIVSLVQFAVLAARGRSRTARV
jgi:hypothetical protein